MSHYKSNLRDIEFNLFEVGRIQDFLGKEPFEQVDEDVARDAIREVERLAREDFAASFVDADRTEVTLDENHEVVLPESVKASLRAYYEGGWDMLSVPKHLGGFGAPSSLRWAAQEMLVGANPAAFFYVSGGLMAVVIGMVGTPEQVEKWAMPMIERKWGGTMVLTEPDAGSDVGHGTTKAVHIEGDTYHIEGVKRFITSGEYDLPENIVHLVLARREGGEPGTKGLSMFIVPKYLMNDDGTVGERNGVFATNVEHKMGIKGSSTCELTLGADKPCIGYLVGNTHEGIRQMFKVIEDARMLIGTKSMSTLSTAYLNALQYAFDRVQSADLTEATNKTAPRVEIIRHPNVRRLLMQQKAHVEGMRALVYYAAWTLDQQTLHPEDEHWGKLNDLLLPLVKGYSSEKAYVLLAQALQIFGGSGFTQDYPMEQYIRDVKIDSLYEGTTAIQALDLFFRKIVRDQGATLTKLGDEILGLVKGGSEEFAVERQLLGTALEDVQGQVGVMVGHAMASVQEKTEIYKTGLHTNGLLDSLAEVVTAWLLLRHAEIASAALHGTTGGDRAFYEGKIASARYFCRNVLPQTRLRREAAEAEDGWLMKLADEAF